MLLGVDVARSQAAIEYVKGTIRGLLMNEVDISELIITKVRASRKRSLNICRQACYPSTKRFCAVLECLRGWSRAARLVE
eukprot:2468429-Rhodomonas_salina.1